ncbi:MAG: hypothetical protein JWR69_2560 [Pedosphaera sp.]|nr:hypothetical protein [Pedosphaera sp.]
MKRITTGIITAVATLLLLALVSPAFAEDKTVTITGEGTCGKCALKETEKCQNVIQVDKKGKKVNYYLVQNDVSKDFHENLCKEAKKVTATGTVKKVDGKMELTASKLELVK